MSLELVSFKLCPFVQRSVIALEYKGVPYDITFIDLENPPEWFADVSPFEKVPVLRVHSDDGAGAGTEANIFESAVISEYINDTHGGDLMPADPTQKALNRAWTEAASACLGDLFQLAGAEDEAAFKRHRAALIDKLEMVEEVLQGPYFNGDQPALIDFAFAPVFMRIDLLAANQTFIEGDELPKVKAWSETLAAMPAVQNSVVPEFSQMYRGMVNKRSPLVAGLLGLA